LLNLYLYKRYREKKKRYSISIDYSTLPKPDKKNLKIGLIAETKIPAYLEPDKMKTHTIVAGATVMGKSISAQVLIEEVLLQNIAVFNFDPTAQWSECLENAKIKKCLLIILNLV
jgi:DNA helicase HerA-like ATPase